MLAFLQVPSSLKKSQRLFSWLIALHGCVQRYGSEPCKSLLIQYKPEN